MTQQAAAGIRVEWNDVDKNRYLTLESDLQEATNLAVRNVTNTLKFLWEGGDDVERHYREFFGEPTEARRDTVRKVYSDVLGEYLHKGMTFVVSKQLLARTDLYGETYENKATGRIEIGGAFLTAPMTGKDSKTGTVIHETSHNVVDSVSDQAVWPGRLGPVGTYSMEQVTELAKQSPDRAVHCAENYEYFVEQGVKRGLIWTSIVDDPEWRRYAESDYTYDDAELLAGYWQQSVDEAKLIIGRKIGWGDEKILNGMLAEARGGRRTSNIVDDPEWRRYAKSDYTYDDAELLAGYWQQSIDDAKLRIGRKIGWGDEKILNGMLAEARRQA